MSLFNFISLLSFPESFSVTVKLEQQSFYSSCSLTKKHSIANIKILRIKNNFHGMNNNNNKLLLATESVYHFTNTNIAKASLFQQLIDKYWQQTIFLSPSTPLSKHYTNNLAKKDTVIVNNKHKKNLIHFSKALLSGHIDSQISCESKKNIPLYIQYIWRKGYDIQFPKLWNKFLSNSKKNTLWNKKQIILTNILKHNNFPLFIITNSFHQMIVAEPGEELITRPSLINSIYQWYRDHCLSHDANNKIYEGWFFINPYDAIEYKDYIKSRYARSSKYNGLNMIPTGIDFYYRLNRQLTSKIYFRLLPDLVEVGKLIKDRAYRKNLVFHPNQKYGRSYFQGQPIYLIQSLNSAVVKKNDKQIVSYPYSILNETLSKEYNLIFLNKETALKAWANICKQRPSLKLPAKPVLIVYNLEDFLKDYEDSLNIKSLNKHLLLVPSKEVYEEISKYSTDCTKQSWLKHFCDFCYPYLLICHVWTKRAVWSLTRRRPPT